VSMGVKCEMVTFTSMRMCNYGMTQTNNNVCLDNK